MRVFVCENNTTEADCPDTTAYDNPLYLGAREGQVTRVANRGITAVGAWDLGEQSYLSMSGHVNVSKFKKHDIVFAADPSRVAPRFRDAYIRLLWKLKTL